MSTEEENKAIVKRIAEEIYNIGNLDIVEEVISPNYTFHYTLGDFKGREGFRQVVTGVRQGFPDFNMTINDMVAEGDTVAIRFTYTGTHLGESFGIPPTGKSVTMDECLFFRFENGMETDEWIYADSLALFQQLGVSPPG